MSTVFTNRTTFVVFACARCSLEFALTREFEGQRRAKRDLFYCPAGHPQWFPGEADETKIQRLASQLDIERSRVERTRKQLDYAQRATKAQGTRLKKVKERVSNGVCPCCQRTFQNLQRHMHTKHPSYGDDHGSDT